MRLLEFARRLNEVVVEATREGKDPIVAMEVMEGMAMHQLANHPGPVRVIVGTVERVRSDGGLDTVFLRE